MGVQVETASGKMEGVQHGGHQAFLGIPFAEPPVGELRFRPPGPPPSWSGLRDASQFASSAPQGTSPIPGVAASGPRDEDCLYLNVYTSRADAGRRPVLFWIHGGGFTMGSGSEPMYDGGPLAERGDVVVVTIHYRLGALGYLYLGGHGGDAWGASANLGQLDQIAALTWVRENIASFGGDPSTVTIFGESAGGYAVASLLAMPTARGLFRRAIAQSGAAYRLGDQESGSLLCGTLLKTLELESADAAKLRELPVEAIVEAQANVVAQRQREGEGLAFAPICDGSTLPQPPLDLVRAGGAAEIDLIAGTNRDEAKLFNAMGRKRAPMDEEQLLKLVRAAVPQPAADRAEALIHTYRSSRKGRLPVENTDILDAIQTDARFRIPATRLVEAQKPHQPNSFLYLFCWESPARRGTLGSCHALELSFVFGTLHAPTQDRFAGSGPDAERLSHQMMDAWLAFARSGDPGHPDIGSWPAYDSAQRNTMIFDRVSEQTAAPFDEERAAWDEILP